MITIISSKDLPRIEQQLRALVTKIPIRLKSSTKKVAQLILDDSLNVPPMCPKDTGKLRKSGRVEATPEGHAVVYGGDGVDYAQFVHDDLRPRKYKLPGSGPKFVEAHVLRREQDAETIFLADLQILFNEEVD